MVRTGPGLFDITDIRAYRERFYRPDLVRLSLLGRPLPENLPTLESIKSAPDVSVMSVPAQINSDALSLQINSPTAAVASARCAYSSTVVPFRKLTAAAADASLPRAAERVAKHHIHLVPGSNEIKVIAYNADGSMHSNPATASVIANFTAKHKPQLHALVVGINQFRNPAFQLRYSVADATAIAQMLQKRASPLFGKVAMELLTIPEATTKEALLAALARYRGIAASDVFVFYVASHGTVEKEDLVSREYFLIPRM